MSADSGLTAEEKARLDALRAWPDLAAWVELFVRRHEAAVGRLCAQLAEAKAEISRLKGGR
jgi:hypothetical protein